MRRIGFLINPVAGMGGRVGLKGTDDVVERAIALGARPIAALRAAETLAALRRLFDGGEGAAAVHWLTCSGAMGADALSSAGFGNVEVAYLPAGRTTGEDTKTAVARFLEHGVDLILFCGGDGTARDICGVVGQKTPILGIPSGVKMYSGVFGTSPSRTAEILFGFVCGRLFLASTEILDLDEEQYRRGTWAVRLHHAALTPHEPTFLQAGKLLITELDESGVKADIAQHLIEDIGGTKNVLVLLGPGSTVQSIGTMLGIDKTLLGIDAIADGKPVAMDVNEREILELLDRYVDSRLILSPIGAQGFVLGRGNLPLSPAVVRRVGAANIVVIATPAKLARTPILRFDTGDAALDRELVGDGYIPVVIGYRLRRLVKAVI